MRVWRTLPWGHKKLIIISTITLLSLICGGQAVFAESSISVSLSTNQVDLGLTADNFNSATQTINVSTTSSVGYTINFAASGATTSLINKNDSTKTILLLLCLVVLIASQLRLLVVAMAIA